MYRHALALAAAVALLPAAALAHHGWSSYDDKQVLKFETSLESLRWASPHGSATTRFRGATWDVILAPVTRMEARGLTREMVAPGRKIVLEGYPRRDGTKEIRIERVTAGGKTVELR